jgi:site-specific DNA recombinase
VVVVYKVDRLTRSLADFAKMVEIFDATGVSFVAVTQQFNTTTSMGRLTLNVLLWFAKFEREVTGERIRDKIAASSRLCPRRPALRMISGRRSSTRPDAQGT